jgi:diguanylate cyclase (GGDEF)-like protein
MQANRIAEQRFISGFATRATLWLATLALGIGIFECALVPQLLARPALALAGIGLLGAALLMTRISVLRKAAFCNGVEILALLLYISLLVLAQKASLPYFFGLYAIPIAIVALVAKHWSQTLLVAAIAAGCITGVVVATEHASVANLNFAVLLGSVLLPGTAAALLLGWMVAQLQEAERKIADLASTDSLTGLLNLRTFEQIFQQEHLKSERLGRPYSLAIVDVDDVGKINEQMGHDAGSELIAAVAKAIGRSIRTSDVAARIGGDEFVVLLIEADPGTATAITQRIRHNVYNSTIMVANRLIRASVSLGLVSFPTDHLYTRELMTLADQRMQQDRAVRRG